MTADPYPRRGIPAGTDLRASYTAIRHRTALLAAPLGPEDMVVQSMPDASPTKWHLAHTTWFFETFVLRRFLPDYARFEPSFGYLFNSYYEALGARQPRAQRGLLTRPALPQVMAYREHVDRHMQLLFDCGAHPGLEDLVRLGLAHEQQHQELLLMDALHLFSLSPLQPAYDATWPELPEGRRGSFRPMPGGLVRIGHEGAGFAFDNELPRHAVWLEPYEICDRLVTNGEWRAFVADGGYARPELWLSDGWDFARDAGWQAPAYWRRDGDEWWQFSLRGRVALRDDAPVAHVSYYEADAYARWAGARLPSEAEWETAAATGSLEQVDGALWQWTRSAYAPYPGFRAADGAVGEYNGKFMVNQMTLRGGACITPPGHARLTYRNFFGPDKRWLFAGVRLARDAQAPRARAAASDDPGARFAADVLDGLSQARKAIPPKYFYDEAGSELFEAICDTPEYYLTRTETALLRQIAAPLASRVPRNAALVEFGSGASAKTRVLLDAAPQIRHYVPIDINAAALRDAAARIARAYPDVSVCAVHGDFTRAVRLPDALTPLPKLGFFPGSTIGNLDPADAVVFLRRARESLRPGASLLLGIDLVKDPAVLQRAYDDAQGVTARFNRNLLLRINRELGGDLDLEHFEHLALWNAEQRRIEMHLVSRVDQLVRVAGHSFAFRAGERLHTENAYKFDLDAAVALAAEAGWSLVEHWTNPAPAYALLLLADREGEHSA
jgi:dimethylhistidine N-methyltransferase